VDGLEKEKMPESNLHAVTGAFGFSGRYIAQHLLKAGYDVITLTNSLHRPNPFGQRVKAYPFHFDTPERLIESLQGVSTLYNTYWVRFNHDTFGFASAIDNSLTLFEAAKQAGVERVVHTSITNPSQNSPLEYFSGKARLEKALLASGLSYAILRPAVLFGPRSILINNIAWMLRKLPVFGVFGDGSYRLQPIHVDDFARLAVEQGRRRENVILDAIGPETFTYRELVRVIGEGIGRPRPIISVPPVLGHLAAALIGKLVGDVVLTRDEIKGLMAGLLYVDGPPAGHIRLSDWVRQNAETLGRRYESELARHR
jgi:NADH dehydrogenase